jgi:alpha-ketoglutarate-dependent taurine dioxygenase
MPADQIAPVKVGTHCADDNELLTETRGSIANHGYAYLCNVPGDFGYLEFLRQFGELMPQYDGRLVWDIRPEPGMDDIYHSKNKGGLVPHTEAYELPGHPPHFVALWCIKQAQGKGGETTMADGYALLSTFSEDERIEMRQREYTWRSSDGLARKGINIAAMHPILEELPDGQAILRYSYNNVSGRDEGFLATYLDRGLRFFDLTCQQIRIERNALLLWDNWRVLHSRSAFTDPARHLRRVLIQ